MGAGVVAAGAMQILGVVWSDHEPHLRLRHTPDSPSKLVPAAGMTLSYQVADAPVRTCLGHVPFRQGRGGYHDCARAPQPGARVCQQCAIVEATFASNLHHAHNKGSAELDPAIQRHLEQPNRLYIAGFRDGSTKIGTSTLSRSERRLEEQGAWSAIYVAETSNGRVVRRLEDAATEHLGLSQSVSASRKLRGLVNPIDDATLTAQLDGLALDVDAQVIASHAADSVTSMAQRWRHPMADHADVNQAIEYPLRLQHGRHQFELITAVGRHLIVRRPDGSDAFAIDPMPLFGLWLDCGNYGSDEIAIQDSLF